MRPHQLIVGLTWFCLLASATPTASAQRFGRDEADDYPLGGIEAMGNVTTAPIKGGGSGIVVKKLKDGGLAAKGKLEVGDVIYAVDGKRLKGEGDEIIDGLCRAIEKAEARRRKGRFGRIVLQVVKPDGKKEKRTVPVRYLGAHSKSCPVKCKKCERILRDALDYLKSRLGGDGRFKVKFGNTNQDVVTSALAGLAFRGAKKGYRAEMLKTAKFVAKTAGHERSMGRPQGGANWNQTNWALAYGSIFLAELVASRQQGGWKSPLTSFCRQLAANQEQSGGWAHGPGGPNALGYLELEIMSNYALGGLGMARRAGIAIDEGKVAKGIEWVYRCTTGGGVAYSPRPGQKGHGDPGRTAGAYWALRQLGRKGKVVSQMKKYFDRNLEKMPTGHVSPAMHILNGALGCAVGGRAGLKRYWAIYRPYIMASRWADGAFDARPTRESRSMHSNADRSHGKAFITAHYALVMEIALGGRFKLLDTLTGRP